MTTLCIEILSLYFSIMSIVSTAFIVSVPIMHSVIIYLMRILYIWTKSNCISSWKYDVSSTDNICVYLCNGCMPKLQPYSHLPLGVYRNDDDKNFVSRQPLNQIVNNCPWNVFCELWRKANRVEDGKKSCRPRVALTWCRFLVSVNWTKTI